MYLLASGPKYQLQFPFTTLLHTQWERGVKIRLRLPEEKECLMRSPRLFALCRRKEKLERIGCTQNDWLWQRFVLDKS